MGGVVAGCARRYENRKSRAGSMAAVRNRKEPCFSSGQSPPYWAPLHGLHASQGRGIPMSGRLALVCGQNRWSKF